MEQPNQEKRVIVVLVLVILVLLAGLIWLLVGKDSTPGFKLDNQDKEFKVDRVEKSPVDQLSGFPSGLPIEPGDEITQSYESTASDGRVQSTKKLITEDSAAVALRKYVEFFEDNDWVRTEDGAITSPVTLKNQKNIVSIIVEATDDNKTKVNITLIQPGE